MAARSHEDDVANGRQTLRRACATRALEAFVLAAVLAASAFAIGCAPDLQLTPAAATSEVDAVTSATTK